MDEKIHFLFLLKKYSKVDVKCKILIEKNVKIWYF